MTFFIQQGDQGPDVVAWQMFLMDQNISLPNFGADGQFGPETTSATKEWQYENGLPESGAVGPADMNRANTIGFGANMNRDQVTRREELDALGKKKTSIKLGGGIGVPAIALGIGAIGLIWWGMRN